MVDIPGRRPVSLGETADKLDRVAADLHIKTEAMRRVFAEALRAVVRAGSIDETKLRHELDAMCDGWDADDDDPVNELCSIFALEVANEIQRRS